MIIGGFIARLLAVIVFITASCFSVFTIAPLRSSASVFRAISAYVTLFFNFPSPSSWHGDTLLLCDYQIYAKPDSKATINGDLIRPFWPPRTSPYDRREGLQIRMYFWNGQSKSVNGRSRRDPNFVYLKKDVSISHTSTFSIPFTRTTSDVPCERYRQILHTT